MVKIFVAIIIYAYVRKDQAQILHSGQLDTTHIRYEL